jgi:predicted acylesterase/phospholipase RssA
LLRNTAGSQGSELGLEAEPGGTTSVAGEIVEPYEQLPAHGEVVDATEPVDLPTRDPVLALQHMETALTRAHVKCPGVLTAAEFRRLRYVLSFARLDEFEPGAAGPGGTRGRGCVQVGEELRAFRARVIDALHGPLRELTDPARRLPAARAALESLTEPLEAQRRALVENHTNDFSPAELDAEVGYKALVLVLGGGGGAGYVYLGGLQRLVEEGLTPSYMLCTSMGAIVGGIAARTTPIPVDEYIAWAKTVTYRGILGPEPLRRRHGLTGMFSLRFDTFAEEMFRRQNGEPLRMRDLAIPCEMVVAGVRRQSLGRLPARFRRSELAALHLGHLPRIRYGMGPAVVSRMWQVAAFIDSRVVKPIVIGGDELTRELNVVDAASFSSAIPGVLHHEPRDPRMHALLDELFAQKDVGALVDGGTASNVPAELAWRRIQDGRLGTRNACYLVWDCFHPQWDPRHLWLQPITQALQVQMVRNAPYADQLVRFKPTLSAITLAASPQAIDRATEWGRASIEPALPVIKRLLEPVWWDGERPPFADGRPEAPLAAGGAAARSMADILKAARDAAQRRPALARWRDQRARNRRSRAV